MARPSRWPILAAAIITSVFILITGAPATAAPANPEQFPLTQPDGSTFFARQWGDEWNNGIETTAGYTIVKDPGTGLWVYASQGSGSLLSPASNDNHLLVVGKDEPVGLVPGIRPQTERPNLNDVPINDLSPQGQNFGAQKLLVLLVDFPDRPGTYTPSAIAARFFGPADSVDSFYRQVSRNQFSFAPASESNGKSNDGVIGWLRMGYNHINTQGSTSYKNAQLVKDALAAAESYINYAAYDTNNDHFISTKELHIVVIVAGYETSYYNPPSPNVWAHRWDLSTVTPYKSPDGGPSGTTLGDPSRGGGYAQFGEIHGTSGSPSQDHLATIGVMAHELGHDISWPDLYDVSQQTEGVGTWSIMGSGSWNAAPGGYDGSSPAHPDAFLKYYQGWVTPVLVKGKVTAASLASVETNGNIYILRYNPGGVDWSFSSKMGRGEYFLVENRQLVGYDAGLRGCGLLVWHIDERRTATNYANNGDHPLVYLEQADGANDLIAGYNRGDAGDPYPGTSNNQSFTDSSHPDSHLYTGLSSSVSITNISSTSCAAPAAITADLSAPYLNFAPSVTSYGGISGIYGYVKEGGSAVVDQDLDMWFYDGSAWSLIATTPTGKDGFFSFALLPALSEGQKYQIEYRNIELNPNRLSSWTSKAITSYSSGQTIDTGTFDIKGIALTSPPNWQSLPFPVVFAWTRRVEVPTDSYQVSFIDPLYGTDKFQTSPLGYIDRTTISTRPEGLEIGVDYGWYVGVNSPEGGYGMSYYFRGIYFTSSTPQSPDITLTPFSQGVPVKPRH